MTGRDKQRRMAGVVAVFAIFGVIAAAAAVAQISASDNTTATDSTTTFPSVLSTTTTLAPPPTYDPAQLSPEAKELYDLVQAGRSAPYHVLFSLAGPSLTDDTTNATLEVWRDPSHIRQDTTLDDKRGRTHGVNIGGPEGTVTCQEQADIPLACQQAGTDPVSKDADLLSTITDRLGTSVVEVRDDTVGDRPARCFSLDKSTQTASELCLSSEGVPLSLETAGLKAVAAQVDASVDASSFVPPAPVSGPSDATVLQSTVITSPPNP